MPEELDLDQSTSDASTLDGGTQDEGIENASAEGAEDTGGEGEGGQQAEQVVTAQAATEPAKPVVQAPVVTSPYAQQDAPKPMFSDATRAQMLKWMDDDAINAMEADMRTFANAEAQTQAQLYVQSYEQQQEMAQELGVPAQYARDVKRYADRVPEQIRGTKQGAAVAVMHGMYERANADPANFDFNAEVAKYYQAVNPTTAAAPAAAPARTAAPVQPLPAAARSSQGQVSGRAVTAPVRGNGVKTNAVLAHFGAED